MPEMRFLIRWPDGSEESCYSPSLVMHDHLSVGTSYPVAEFLRRAGAGLDAASERVRAKYGMACTGALEQMQRLQHESRRFPAEAPVLVEEMSPGLPPVARRSFPVVVVGGGQAGLSVSWLLRHRHIDHVVLERETIAHDWVTGRWDNFALVTPNWMCRLPGYSYGGPDPDGFMTGRQTYEWLLDYARSFDPPVEEHVEVTAVDRDADGYLVRTSVGDIRARVVVIATGAYHRPIVPEGAATIPPRIAQVQSADYRNPDQLPPGGVLVVGGGQSGTQIAEDLLLAGREVSLSIGHAPRVARRYRGADCMTWLSRMGVYEVTAEERGLEKRESTNHYVTGRDGGHDIDLRDFACRGVRLYGRLKGVDGTKATFAPTVAESLDYADSVADSIKNDIDAYIDKQQIRVPAEPRALPVWRPNHEITSLDLDTADITTIIWAIGFRTDYSWVHVPVFDDHGYPQYRRGETDSPGLYFLGLPWLHTWGSGRFLHIADDAEYVVDRLERVLDAAPLVAGR